MFALCAISVFYFIIDEEWLASVQDNSMFGVEDLRLFLKLDSKHSLKAKPNCEVRLKLIINFIVQIRELSILIITTLIALHIFMNSLLLAGIYKVSSHVREIGRAHV